MLDTATAARIADLERELARVYETGRLITVGRWMGGSRALLRRALKLEEELRVLRGEPEEELPF